MSENVHQVRPTRTTLWLTVGVVVLVAAGVATKLFGVLVGGVVLAALIVLAAVPIQLFVHRARMERVGRTVIVHNALGGTREIDCSDVASAGVYTVKNGTPATNDRCLLIRFQSDAPSFMMRGVKGWSVEKLQWLFAGGGVDLANVPGVTTKDALEEHFPGAF